MILTPIIAAFALIVSTIALLFSRRSWRETYRPIIVAKVLTVSAGNITSLYNLVVANCGNRPAKNIRLRPNKEGLQAALNPKAKDEHEGVLACFSENACIQVLANGDSTNAYFGTTGVDERRTSWIPDSSFDVEVTYEGFDGVKFRSQITLRISVGPSFTGWCWGEEKVTG